MRSMLDLSQNKYSSQWRRDNAKSPGQIVLWQDRDDASMPPLKAKIIKFMPKGSEFGFGQKQEKDTYEIELLEDSPNKNRHRKGERIFATDKDLK